MDPPRCFQTDDPVYLDYHDHEWGRPLTDERSLYEKICLEGFQSGLSWAVVLRKRPALREVFAGFDPEVVAGLGPADVERLLADERIIRNRRKIEATIVNAAATLALRDTDTPLDILVWSFRPEPGPAPASFADLPTETVASTGLSKALKRAGFRFVGPTTMYALMQAGGLVNDHLAGCFVRDEVGREQALAAEQGKQRWGTESAPTST
jgi:DNA-3-methyladenine glycosylase I